MAKNNIHTQRFIVVFLLLIVAALGIAAESSFPNITQVRHLSRDKGLSSHRVYSIVHDTDNVLWVSTKNGVDRFNGHMVRNYNLQVNTNYGDMAARKIQLETDVDGGILAYDNTGRVFRYSKIYNDFIPEFDLDDMLSPGATLNRLHVVDNGTFYFCLSSGLYVKASGGAVEPLKEDVYVNDVCEVADDCYIGTSDGIYVLKNSEVGKSGASRSAKGGRGKAKATDEQRYMPDIAVETLFYDSVRGKVMVGTFNDGLWEIDAASGNVAACSSDISDPIRSILRFNDRYIALGIDGAGVFLYDVENGEIAPLINTDDRNEFTINGNGIYAMTQNVEGNLWVGSYTGGASFIKFTPVSAKAVVHEKSNPNSLANNNVNAIYPTPWGDVWYATDRGVSISKPDGRWTHALEEHVCVSLCRLANGRIAVGTYGDGVYVLDEHASTVSTHTKQNSALTSNNIFSIISDNSGDIWIGGIDGNFICFDSQWNKKAEYPIFPVFSIVSLDSNRVAASTVNGFYIIDKATGKFDSYATFEEQSGLNMSAYIIPMLFNGDGTVWLGTSGGGLNLYDLSSRKVVKGYKIQDGLPSNDVYCLLKHPGGDLWIGTGKGAAILSGDKIVSLNYNPGSENECNKLSGAVLNNGNVMFGSTNGAISFNPMEINQTDSQAPLNVTSFRIEGMNSEESEAIAPELYNGVMAGHITLSHDDNSFIVNFESISLKYQDDIFYKYYLENYDEDWNEKAVGEAVYKKLKPGNYKLYIKSVHRSDGSVIDERVIEIDIRQPWYNTWWAWVIYILIVCLAAFWAMRHKLDRMQKRYYKDKIRFFVNTAHDIRTPVTLAMAPLEDAKRDETLSESNRYLINTAYRNVKKLNALTTQLLNFEKFDSENYEMNWQTIDMCAALTQEAACFEDTCRRKGVAITLDLPDTAACIHGDINLIEHVLDNLISNACKYTNAGGTIKLGCRVLKSDVVVTITDSGIGIPKREHKYIFSDVHRARNARESQEIGTGFGLMQVKRLVEMLQGEVTFSSVEGKGSEFTIVFRKSDGKARELQRVNPTTAVSDEILASIPDEPEIVDNDVAAKDATVMIVEDNDDMRVFLGRVLRPYYHVVLHSSADEALEEVKTVYPDLIISDVMMPGMQGDDFCDRLKSDPDTAGIPVVLLTAKAGHEAIVAGLKKGADDYLTKPFSTEILMLKVKGILENRARLREYLLRKSVEQALEPLRESVDSAATAKSDSPAKAAAPEGGPAPLTGADSQFVEKATMIVLDNISNADFTIEMLCREMAMSRTLFYGRLKSLTGKAPQEFIRLLRLERAAEMLRSGANVNDVAQAAGFANAKYFSTIFKKHFGVQPSRFFHIES